MSDLEVATKAPESDATEQSAPPTDGPHQGATGLSEHCTTDRPARESVLSE
jgi:hypothetical protein